MSRPLLPRIDRSRPPAATAVEPYTFPRFVRRILPGGLEVVPVPIEGAHLVSLDLVFPAGADFDPPGGAGTASLVAGLLDEGSQEHTALEIASSVERLGGILDTGADWSVASASAQMLADHLEPGLGLLAEIATRATFPEEEVERARRNRLTDLLRRRDSPSVMASDHFSAQVYDGTRYGKPLVGTAEEAAALERDTLVAFYRAHYRLSGATLIAVGDLDPEGFVDLASGLFTDVAPEPGPPLPTLLPPRPEGVRIRIVDRPGAAQTELRVGHEGVPRTDPDWSPLSVLNVLLGGKFISRINLNLRERHGMTYSASSRLSPRLGPGPLAVGAAVDTPAVGLAVREILGELERMREEPVGADELRDTKSYMLGTFPYGLQTVAGVLHLVENLGVYGLPDDYYAPERYLERLEAVTEAEIRRVARAHLHPGRASVTAVGPAAELARQLEGLGTMEIVGR